MRRIENRKTVTPADLKKPLLFDGAMGTYYAEVTGNPSASCEAASLEDRATILNIHQKYLEAGARAIKTNTFSLPALMAEGQEARALALLDSAAELALLAVDIQGKSKKQEAFVFADLGPVPEEAKEQAASIYVKLAWRFLAHGIWNFLFETQSEFETVNEVARQLKQFASKSFILTSFAVGADGVSRKGISGRSLLEQAAQSPAIDAIGLNCMAGPSHLFHLIKDLGPLGKPLSVMPNAGYPDVLGRRTVYRGSPEYFSSGMMAIAHQGASIIGGCCGTTPEHISQTAALLAEDAKKKAKKGSKTARKAKEADLKEKGKEDGDQTTPVQESPVLAEPGILQRNAARNKKSLLVELDPPANDSISFFIEGVSRLKQAGADMITIADNPIGRPRADSSILACKIKREIDIEVLPHMTCRDRNLNAIKALLLGLSIEDVHHVLLVTGDPLPDEARNEVKAVFSFNSRTLAGYVHSLGQDGVCTPFHMLGALDVNARNFDVQLRLAKEKEANGMCGFLTQPVFSQRALDNLKRARMELKGLIFGGLMPIVSHKNALFLTNEITGMDIPEEMIEKYRGLDRKQAEDLAIELTLDTAARISGFVDGYYLMTPFKRVELSARILDRLQKERPDDFGLEL